MQIFTVRLVSGFSTKEDPYLLSDYCVPQLVVVLFFTVLYEFPTNFLF